LTNNQKTFLKSKQFWIKKLVFLADFHKEKEKELIWPKKKEKIKENFD
jgi:hypothetical protein